ncbi:MAG: hypothetical protein BWY66_02153 [bacterium ADurb.Bin374]|nr:MAG: hypothetical protein BWY66_02153 [bacterium ADurb.Bin374]
MIVAGGLSCSNSSLVMSGRIEPIMSSICSGVIDSLASDVILIIPLLSISSRILEISAPMPRLQTMFPTSAFSWALLLKCL